MEKSKLNKLKKGIRGHQKKVAELSGVSITTVSRVLNGDFENDEVIRTAINVRNIVLENRRQLEQMI